MKSSVRQGLAILVICLSMLLPAASATARQPTAEATQTVFTDCGPDILVEESSRAYPVGLHLVSGCVTYDKNLQQYTIVARYVIDPGTTLNNADTTTGNPPDENLAQIGQTSITVVSGSLAVTVTKLCVPLTTEDCAPFGAAYVGRPGSDADFDWSAMAVGTETTVNAGEIVYLQDVMAKFASGDQGAVITTFGVFSVGGGQGCPTACFHMP